MSRTGNTPNLILLLAVSLLALSPFPAGAQIVPQGTIEIEEGGELWIEGSASIVDYTCNAEELSGNGNIENTNRPQENVKGHGMVAITVSIPVTSLDCGKRAMNKDMYEALKADRFSTINFTLLDAVLVETDSTATASGYIEKWMNIRTTGILEIAGVKDTTDVFVNGWVMNNERFRVKGSKQISMKRFDIKPPTALLGLIKASSELTVHFDVTVRLKDS